MKPGYAASFNEFIEDDPQRIVGILVDSVASRGIASQYSRQIEVWNQELHLLKKICRSLIASCIDSKDWHILLEYELPRRQKRPDAIILANDIIFVVEFKWGADKHDSASRWQVQEYALDLRDFHAESHGRHLIPVLCATEAPTLEWDLSSNGANSVFPVQLANIENLEECLASTYSVTRQQGASSISPQKWIHSDYRPTMTIIEAAECLYNNHDVREISHSYADNLDITTNSLLEIIQNAQRDRKYCVCFVTGVPGAGKTLTGLNVVHNPSIRSGERPSGIFLSGNGPLVKVVREALIQSRIKGGNLRRDSEHEVSTFIQNVHNFLRYHLASPEKAPHEHVLIFDEAQRAWDSSQMNRKQGIERSEASILLEIMERLPEWGVLIALVGGGQEIYLGEAGLEEWGAALQHTVKHWEVLASPEVLDGGTSVAGHSLFNGGIRRV
jgi:hypothetical protein